MIINGLLRILRVEVRIRFILANTFNWEVEVEINPS